MMLGTFEKIDVYQELMKAKARQTQKKRITFYEHDKM